MLPAPVESPAPGALPVERKIVYLTVNIVDVPDVTQGAQ